VSDPSSAECSCQGGQERRRRVKADYWAIFDVPDTIEPGSDAVKFVQQRIDVFAHRWRDSYPAAVRCLLDDRDSLTVYLHFPREHWPRIRHSNFIERTFGETRRRVKVIGRLPGEHSCLSVIWAVLDRASTGWRGLTMTSTRLRQLHDLRRSLHAPPPKLPRPITTEAADNPNLSVRSHNISHDERNNVRSFTPRMSRHQPARWS
jgi:hypothetical protein